MLYIAKTAQMAANVGDTIRIAERPMYGGKDIGPGDVVFLWASETQGGRGLWARGTVLKSEVHQPQLRIDVRVDQMVTSGHLGLEQIAPHRDSTENTPIVGLARKLYKHAHNKIAGATNGEADLMMGYFK